jgi:hypothetical protein
MPDGALLLDIYVLRLQYLNDPMETVIKFIVQRDVPVLVRRLEENNKWIEMILMIILDR